MNRSRRYQPNKPFVSGGYQNSPNVGNKQMPQHLQQQRFSNANESNFQNHASEQYGHQQQQQQRQSYNANPPQNQPMQQKPIENKVPEQKPQEQQLQQQEQQQEQQDLEPIENEELSEQNVDDEAADDDMTDIKDSDGKLRFKKIFMKRKKSSVRAREKKIRQNRQLRKAITPKNALMALNELKNIEMSDFVISNTTGGFVAVVTVNGNQYEGQGSSKTASKNNACEKALRDFVIAKMISKPRLSKTQVEDTSEPMDADDCTSNAGTDAGNNDEADELPMLNLASFALFKLFSEWETEGFVIPEMHRTSNNNAETNGSDAPKEPKKPPIRTELPPNWESMHPATLLCMMRPGVSYVDCGTLGEKPNILQKVMVTVDEQTFNGTGRSKKLARRNAAVSVCNTLFGTNFTDE